MRKRDPCVIKPSKEVLRRLYLEERISPEVIGQRYGLSGRQVRARLEAAGVPRLGPKHLRGGKKAGPAVRIPKRTLQRLYVKEKLPMSEIGRRYGLGRATISKYIAEAGIQYQGNAHSLRRKAVQIPTHVLKRLYMKERLSSEEIGRRYGISGRTIRQYLSDAGIPLLGPAHLRKGKSATWNVGLTRSAETRKKCSSANVGRVPHNKGLNDIRFICEWCGVEASDKPYRRKRFCTKTCRDQFNAANDGEKHFNYKHGLDGRTQRQRLWKRVLEWRKAVIDKSVGACAVCGAAKRLEAHHLNNWANHPDERFDVRNGVCLCSACHKEFHSQFGMKFCTKEMFYKWREIAE